MSVNKAILIGNVGRDPDVRYPAQGQIVATFPLATSERGYTRQDGTQVPERTEWHNIVVWGRMAETVEKYVRKGTKLYIEGKIRTRNWEDRNSIKRYVTEIYVDNMEMLGSRPAPAPQQPVQQPQPAQQPQTSQQPAAQQGQDLPF